MTAPALRDRVSGDEVNDVVDVMRGGDVTARLRCAALMTRDDDPGDVMGEDEPMTHEDYDTVRRMMDAELSGIKVDVRGERA